MNIFIAIVVTAAVLSMAVAASLMIYDTTSIYSGLSAKTARRVTFLGLWPVAVGGFCVICLALGSLWGRAL